MGTSPTQGPAFGRISLPPEATRRSRMLRTSTAKRRAASLTAALAEGTTGIGRTRGALGRNCYLSVTYFFATIEAEIELLRKSGDPGGDRTHDPVIKSHMLYH